MSNIGRLQVQVYKQNSFIPIQDANITVSRTVRGMREQVTTLTTSQEGQSQVIDLDAPPVELSLNPNNNIMPYALYDVSVIVPGYDELIINGCQILSDQTALQICNMIPSRINRETGQPQSEVRIIDIQPNRQFGDFPPKIPEDPNKPLPPPPSGLVVLPAPVVPEFIIVHAGTPSNSSAPNYKVPYRDYIKNVASSEIYATWPESSIRANIYCIISFTLNRIFTEWYRGKGYDFDVTNSTAYDQAFSYGRNIYESISSVVDDIFATYVKREGAKQPLLTQYCDGKNVKCPGWLTQWGSKDLGEKGYIPFDILTNFYGNDIILERAKEVKGSPKSYPGYVLKIGSSGPEVKTVQEFLNRISKNYPLIPKVPEDGRYEQSTADQVKVFQKVFKLPQTGQVDYATWYKISDIYVGVTKIAELRSDERADTGDLQIQVYERNTFIPIPKAKVTITSANLKDDTGLKPQTIITSDEGRTDVLQIETPSVDRSLNPNNTQIPYALVNATISAEGYVDLIIKGIQVLPFEKSIQVANLIKSPLNRELGQNVKFEEIIEIPDNVQYGKYPPKIPEDPNKPLPPPPSGLVVLPEPVIPEYIIVHGGAPSDSSAPNYKVSYIDYLKNVASSEIYATWPDSTIRANVYSINSFALNRIYTEWYRSKGYDFDVTNSTAYDQAFVYGRNIFDNISTIVDELFSTYIKRDGAKQPLLSQYCDGRNVSCPQWLSQWGSKDLGEKGYTPYEILTYYYGNDIVLDRAPKVLGSPKSYPGYILQIGSKGEPVKTIQSFLNRIAKNYPLIGKVPVDGVYGPRTAEQVRLFQQVFNLPQTGQVDYSTWYKISAIYVGVTKIAELKGADIRDGVKNNQGQYAYFIPPSPYSDAADIPKIKYPLN